MNRNGEVQPGQAAVITIPDLNKDNITALEATDDQLSKISSANLLLYVFVVVEYTDEDRSKEDWRLEYCGYFVTTYAYWHHCAWPSRVYRLPPVR